MKPFCRSSVAGWTRRSPGKARSLRQQPPELLRNEDGSRISAVTTGQSCPTLQLSWMLLIQFSQYENRQLGCPLAPDIRSWFLNKLFMPVSCIFSYYGLIKRIPVGERLRSGADYRPRRVRLREPGLRPERVFGLAGRASVRGPARPARPDRSDSDLASPRAAGRVSSRRCDRGPA